MEVHSLGFCVRIHPGFEAGVSTGEEGRLWWCALVFDKTNHHVKIHVGPTENKRNWECPLEFQASLRGRYSYAYAGSEAQYFRKDGEVLFAANSLPVAISRALGAAYEREMGGHVTYELDVAFGAGAAPLRFKSEMEIGLDDVLSFGNDLGFTVAALVSEPPLTAQVEPVLAEMANFVPRADSSVFEGDGRGVSSGRVPQVEPAHEDELCSGPFDETADFILANELSPRDKYGALAHRLTRVLPVKHPNVLILGDHPGVLSRALVGMGVNVWGVDPKNPEGWLTEPGGCGRGRRNIIGDTVRSGMLPDWILERNWDAVVADTTCDGEAAEVTTARNVGLLSPFSCVTIAQTRSMPMKPNIYHALPLPGHGKQGCELYVAVGKWDGNFAWHVDVRDDGSVVTVVNDDYADCALRNGISMDGVTFPMDEHGWYNWVSLRHAVRARQLAKMPSGRAVFDAVSAPELFVKLSRIYDLHERRKGDLRDLFENGRLRDVPGLPAGLLSVSSTLRSAIATRYSALAKLCVRTASRSSYRLDKIFSDPRAGYLLENLSEMRSHLDGEHLIAQQYRVLPWESLAVLSSQQYFKILQWYVHAVARIVGKPMHSWELQRLLFVLTSHGTHEERMAYMCMKLGDLFARNYTGRRAPPVADRFGPIERFLQRLDQLGLRQQYMSSDPDFAQAVAGGSTHSPQPNVPVRKRRESTQASSVRSYSRGGLRGFSALS
jgi:hypothetical protein